MKRYVLIILLSFSAFSCPEGDIYKQKPNFEILSTLRDSGASFDEVEHLLKEVSLGNDHLTTGTLVNWEGTAKEQLMRFGKHLRKAIHRKHLGFNSIQKYENPREEAVSYFSEQLNAYFKAMYSNRRDWQSQNIIDDVEIGETLYFIKDMQNSEHGIQINYKREYGEEGVIKPLFIMSHITYSGSIPHRLDGRKNRVMMKLVTPEFWTDKNYQLWELYLKPAK